MNNSHITNNTSKPISIPGPDVETKPTVNSINWDELNGNLNRIIDKCFGKKIKSTSVDTNLNNR